MKDCHKIVDEIYESLKDSTNRGEIASYIPELEKVDINKFGMHILTLDNKEYGIGNYNEQFSLQSISKVLSLALALNFEGAGLWKRVNVEPSGDPFNFLSLLELEKGIPRNPFINAGALVVCDVLVSHLKKPKEDFLDFVKELAEDDSIYYDESVARSEEATGYGNAAAANLLKSFENINNDVEEVLDFYFHQCAISMSCEQLSKVFYTFANSGKSSSGKVFFTSAQVKRINTLMLTCGFYDEAGEFAFKVGLPGKSGVGGGIAAVQPGKYSISVWSPGLNRKKNSLLGTQALEMFTTKTGISIF